MTAGPDGWVQSPREFDDPTFLSAFGSCWALRMIGPIFVEPGESEANTCDYVGANAHAYYSPRFPTYSPVR